ncbi:MAG: hypothetical protein PHU47_00185 [Candidatus ainarchaeum sp.]|nr:hypothetical protein [Candidatus ainarchaeum sp.]
MLSLSAWETIFEGKYGDQELSILYNDDYFVSFLRSRHQDSLLIQVYKVFLAYGELELFVETLPNQCIFYQKHLDLGEKNTHKFLLINTETELIDNMAFTSYIEKKIAQLNKQTSSIISVIKSYNIKLVSLKMLSEDQRSIFFSDPFIIKTITNFPTKNINFLENSTVNKLIIGKKNDVTITGNIETLRSVLVTGSELDDRLYSVKLVCENYLLSGKKVLVFDSTGVFKSLSYPQQHEDILFNFDIKIAPFGFPSKSVDYFKIKMPLSVVPKKAFCSIFHLTSISEKIIEKIYSNDLLTIADLREKMVSLETDDDITEFEKKRVFNKLNIIEKKYATYFGKTDCSMLFEDSYSQIGSCRILRINLDDPFCVYYIYSVIKEIENIIKEDVLVAIPESKETINSLFVGNDVLKILVENPKLNYVISSEYLSDFIENFDNLAKVHIEVISGNDVVIRYPDRDPLRLLLRPTLTSSNVFLKQ